MSQGNHGHSAYRYTTDVEIKENSSLQLRQYEEKKKKLFFTVLNWNASAEQQSSSLLLPQTNFIVIPLSFFIQNSLFSVL